MAKNCRTCDYFRLDDCYDDYCYNMEDDPDELGHYFFSNELICPYHKNYKKGDIPEINISDSLNTKVKAIVGDSTGIDAAKIIAEHYTKNHSYRLYGTDSRCGKQVLSELKQKSLNCSDKAPHLDEIELLHALGLSYPQIRKILEQKYYSDIINK